MHQQHGRLLLVDGEVARAERLAKRLAHLGLEIQIVGDGANGILDAHERRPDAVIVAADAPIVNGYLVIQALRSEPATRGVPVILVTEGSSHEELARGWHAGADLCVPRNQGEADVLATLHRALSNLGSRMNARENVALIA